MLYFGLLDDGLNIFLQMELELKGRYEISNNL